METEAMRGISSTLARRAARLSNSLDGGRAGPHSSAPEDLAVGVQVAWRNANDCIGRAYWRRLEVVDARQVVNANEMFDALIYHLERSTNNGNIRLLLTLFPPKAPDGGSFRIWNSQLVRYAGYQQSDGTIVGDPETIATTNLAMALGWRGTGGPFDVLPLLLQVPGKPISVHELPGRCVMQVPITHPRLSSVDSLDLRWYSHPTLSSMRLNLEGLDYTAAPFSGWYTLPEVAVRAFGDTNRYNKLQAVAEAIGLPQKSRTLWRDKSLIVLMEAVLHSFENAGVTMVDHHFIAASFLRHVAREAKEGREVGGNWRSLLPAAAPSTSDLYACHFSESVLLPNFFPQSLTPE